MTNFAYQAVDAAGQTSRGTLTVGSQNEALQRIRDMGLFPVKLTERQEPGRRVAAVGVLGRTGQRRASQVRIAFPVWPGGVKPRALAVFTRQLATLIDAGMPLLRGLRILQQQEANPRLKRVIGRITESIEGGDSFTDALRAHPTVFNALYVNLVRAGEISGALEIALSRLAELMEKTEKIKGKVKAAMLYPVAVMLVAAGILTLMMVFIVPRFQSVFDGLMGGAPMPAFTRFVIHVSELCRQHAPAAGAVLLVGVAGLVLSHRSRWGRFAWDRLKISAPAVGPVFRKTAISRLARTLGTLLGNGVPVLQALTIARETAGNQVVARMVTQVHGSVKQGETVAAPLRNSNVLPPVFVGMVDVGEQTGALPAMLMKIADQCDDDVDNAVAAMTSLLEPLLILFLACVVGSIVIAMFLPIIGIIGSDNLVGGVTDG